MKINIFKNKHENTIDDVNLYSTHNTIFVKTQNGIKRVYSDISVMNWEMYVYFYLDDRCPDIIPNIDISDKDKSITYCTINTIPLKKFLDKNIKKYSCILNELVSFVNTFKKYKFVHGNLHISNILVDTTNEKFYKFYIIDLSNSYIPDFENPNQRRSSFVNKNIPLEFCDMTTLYHSIVNHLSSTKSNKKIIVDITRIFSEHIIF